MSIRSSFGKALAAAALALLGPAGLARSAPPPAPLPASQPATTAPALAATPALWKIADADTTIYLFGTIHILPPTVDWFRGPVAHAFTHSDLLVTELPDVKPVEFLKGMARYGVLPAGPTLRDRMGEERRGRFEAALAGLGIRADMYDRNKPWVPATLIPLITIQKASYDPSLGVEAVLDAKAKAQAMPRIGLETLDYQFGLLSAADEAQQLDTLDVVLKGVPEMTDTIGRMVTLWSAGDDAGLAALLNVDTEPAVAETLLYARNRTWARWIEARMAQPGTVFVAVGAGHLGGPKSVNDLLRKGGYRLSRVQ